MSLTPRLVGVAGVMARHGGRAAAVAIASEAREWLRDPANEPARWQEEHRAIRETHYDVGVPAE